MTKDFNAGLCAGLFDDLTKVFYGVYENESKYDQYEISVFYISESTKILLSTVDLQANACFRKEDVKSSLARDYNALLTTLQRNRLDPEPKMYIINSYTFQSENDIYGFINTFYPENKKTKDNDRHFDMHMNKNPNAKVYVYIHVHEAINVPDIVRELFSQIHQAWKFYFLHYEGDEGYIPICRVNNLIENLYPTEKRFFSVVTEISSKYYEKKRCSGKIIITGGDVHKQQRDVLIPLNGFDFDCKEARMLRKLVEMTNANLAVLVDSDGKLYGIGEKKDDSEIKAVFRILNHLEWEMCDKKDDKPLLKFKYGKYYLPYQTDIEGSYIIRKTIKMPEETQNLIRDIIKKLRSNGHGALVIVTNEAEKEVDRLCKFKCGVKTEPRNLFTEENKSKQILSALTSVDGAVFLDEKGFCHGFGMILDGDTYITGSPDRGSRLNSAKRYIARKKVDKQIACAVIISDDNYVNIISGYDMGVDGDGSIKEQ